VSNELPVVDGILLRAPEPSDAGRWFEMICDADEERWARPVFVDPIESEEAVREHIEKQRRAIAAGEPASYVVTEEGDPTRLLGTIQWRIDTHPGKRVVDIGYGVHPDARGRGVARRAMRALTAWLVSDDGPGFARVQLDHSTENVASCRAALAAGFEQEGVRRSVLPLRDPVTGVVRRHDVCLHGWVRPGA
jgi:RimJ/RimL family protein N-acetyltransferase